jgi:hypothetical protein
MTSSRDRPHLQGAVQEAGVAQIPQSGHAELDRRPLSWAAATGGVHRARARSASAACAVPLHCSFQQVRRAKRNECQNILRGIKILDRLLCRPCGSSAGSNTTPQGAAAGLGAWRTVADYSGGQQADATCGRQDCGLWVGKGARDDQIELAVCWHKRRRRAARAAKPRPPPAAASRRRRRPQATAPTPERPGCTGKEASVDSSTTRGVPR